MYPSNNPTGKVFTSAELEFISKLCIKHDLVCITDEAYEYMTYDNYKHISIASASACLKGQLQLDSYSKTFAITGWRIGYLVAPDSIIAELRSTSDQVYVCAPCPFQYAVATGINNLGDDYYKWILDDVYLEKEKYLLMP